MHLTRKSRLIGGAITLLVLGVVGFVYAAWTASGTGSGTAKAIDGQAVTTSAVAITNGDLYPGASGGVHFQINNPNPYPVRVTAIAGTGTITSDAGAACDASTGVSFTNQTGLTIDIPASGSTTVVRPNAAQMSNASDTTCQGATFTIPVSLTAASNA